MTTTLTTLTAPTDRDILLPSVRPNAGLHAQYRKRLLALVKRMQAGIVAELAAQYRETPPMAADESPAKLLRGVMERLSRFWIGAFDDEAMKIARWFAEKILGYTDAALGRHLAEAGFGVKFTMTRGMNDAYQAVIGEQVGLIRSIAQQHLTQVETLVMQSVQRGRDLSTLTTELQRRYGVTQRRAALIARDQNNKATAVLNATRQQELGIRQAIWVHSGAGKDPRPSHVKAGREKLVFNLDKGAYLDKEWVLPGQAINCRCFARPIIPGFKY